jgi:hypothetical protein
MNFQSFPFLEWLENTAINCQLNSDLNYSSFEENDIDVIHDVEILFDILFESMFQISVKDAINNYSWIGEDTSFPSIAAQFFPLSFDFTNYYKEGKDEIYAADIVDLDEKGGVSFYLKYEWVTTLVREIRDQRRSDGIEKQKFIRAYEKIVELLDSREASLCKVKFHMKNHLQKWPEDVKDLYESTEQQKEAIK